MKKRIRLKQWVFLVSFLIIGANTLSAQSNEDCMMCHEDSELTTERNGMEVSMFVDTAIFMKSVHTEMDCIYCHEDADVEDFPHAEKLMPVNCANCHDEAFDYFNKGIHGVALRNNQPFAPGCADCHGGHDILSGRVPESRTYKMNIPILCGNCHKEGAPVDRTYNLTEHNIVENYSQGIHGKGLFESGLFVTATCNDCHGNHFILPSSSRFSSVSTERVARTCMKCHVQIERTHKKVIKDELWEKEPGAVPSCTACHPPHKVEYEKVETTISNQSCLKCHDKNTAAGEFLLKQSGDTIRFDRSHLSGSVHYNIQCVKCHTEVTSDRHRPCETVKKVDCSNCHIEVSNEYFGSGHGRAFVENRSDAPYCNDCHDTHATKSKIDESSPTYRGAIPQLCGSCHKEDGQANMETHLKEVNAFSDYSQSTHGKGLTNKGLLVSAVCIDCHTTHHELKESNPLSSVHPQNMAATCAKCHKSIADDYEASEHSIAHSKGDVIYPTCSTCHTAHIISDIQGDKFMNEITNQCGSCHKKLSETYQETYHGKAYLLGDAEAARCSDCHGAHKILKVSNPDSEVGFKNIVQTCQQCHENANLAFTGYLTHATHNDNDVLFWAFWGMTSLLIAVFGFFGLHTLFWLPQSLKQRRKHKPVEIEGAQKYYRRFNKRQRVTHIMVILSFLLLALTGMTLKFAHMEWANWIARQLGGVKSAGNIHRFAALITFAYFTFHLSTLFQLKKKSGLSVKEFLFGSNSLMFSKQDIRDFVSSMKWFFGKGPRLIMDAGLIGKNLIIWLYFGVLLLLASRDLFCGSPNSLHSFSRDGS